MNPAAPIRRVVVPSLAPGGHSTAAMATASVLADWFGVPLRLVTDDPDRLRHLRILAQGTGVPTEHPLLLDHLFADEMADLADEEGPILVVADPTPTAMGHAAHSTQPTLLVAEPGRRRAATGPLVLDAVHGLADIETLAVAGSFATALDHPVRIVEEIGAMEPDDAMRSEARLAELGIAVSVDRVRPHGQNGAVIVARTRGALALIVPGHAVDDPDTTKRALRNGVNVLVAPSTGRTGGVGRDPLETPTASERPGETEGRQVEILDHAACTGYLAGTTLGRLGFVSDGWPVVLPVNYRLTEDGGILIKSVEGGKTAAAETAGVVCFEIDGIDEASRQGWSVVVHGELRIVRDAPTLETAWRNDPQPWLEGTTWRWLTLSPLAVSGRRLRPG
ncbi:MAG: pyridoxamine 5'-phosphate oxidase family protein [Actinomycetota bacterium]